jgi:hypothetical protein
MIFLPFSPRAFVCAGRKLNKTQHGGRQFTDEDSLRANPIESEDSDEDEEEDDKVALTCACRLPFLFDCQPNRQQRRRAPSNRLPSSDRATCLPLVRSSDMHYSYRDVAVLN